MDRIDVSRQSAQYSQEVFRKGTNDWNHYTLFDLIGAWYGLISTSQVWRTTDRYTPIVFWKKYPQLDTSARLAREPYGRYPDLTQINLRRPSKDGRQWTEEKIDLSESFRSASCGGDIQLQWGDMVDIPEADHPVNEPWPGLDTSVLTTLKKCLTRHIQLAVKGQTHDVALSPDISFNSAGEPDSIGPEISFMLRPALLRSNLILASSDLTRVKVTRADPTTGQKQEWVLNCSDAATAPDLWLRDGDQIEIPEK
jgi:hypothetical protein